MNEYNNTYHRAIKMKPVDAKYPKFQVREKDILQIGLKKFL